jgi:S1-C subfamily serine protease
MVSGNGGVSLNIGGLRLVPVGEELASYLGRGSERGLLVIDVPPWAGKALQAGDVVLRVENRPVRTGQSLEEVVVDLPRFRDATVDILRDGEHRAVTLPARR